MKRILTIAFALTLVATSAFAQENYGWSISASSTDPAVNSGSVAPGLPASLYLHLDCTTIDGMAAMEADIAATGLLFLSFTPLNGVLNAGAATSLLLAVGGCPTDDFLAGAIGVLNLGAGGDVCLVPSAANGTNGTVDCDTIDPQLYDNAVVGFSTSGQQCVSGDCRVEVSVEAQSWGGVKSLYK